MPRRVGLILVLAAVAGGFLYQRLVGDDSDGDVPTLGAEPTASATCADGGPSPAMPPRGSAALGPLVLIGARYAASRPPDAFGGTGYKLPVSIPEGTFATLSVPRALRARVGLVFSLDTQSRVAKRGVRGANRDVHFSACPGDAQPGRTGWSGGIVVDRPRCATLVVSTAAAAPARHRVPLGRPC